MNNPTRVLLIEDDREDYLMICDMLAAIPNGSYKLDWTATYDEALPLIQRRHHDLYIVDYVLGGKKDGLQLIQEAFPNGCDLPVILLTARGKDETDATALQLGVAEYFDKVDIRVPLLERAIRYAINTKRVEVELRASEMRFRSLFAAAPDYIYLVDREYRILQTNASAISGSGYAEAEFLGHRLDEFLTPTLRQEFLGALSTLFESGHLRYEVEFIRQDGSIQIMDCSGSVFTDSKNHELYAIIIQRDITYRKQAEQALQAALRHEKELNDLKSHFVSTVSHEFRTPMAIIRTGAELLKRYRNKMDAEAIDKKLDTIFVQVDHLSVLVDDVLTLSRIESGRIETHPTTVNLPAFCWIIVEDFKERYDRTHQVNYTTSSDRLMICVDETLLRQIVVNLLDNAIKYTPQGGTVSLDIAAEAQEVVLRFVDTGIGIPEESQQYLFEPFHRGNNVNTIPGTGLGLSIVKQAVNLCQGSIVFETQPLVGTTFVIKFPRC